MHSHRLIRISQIENQKYMNDIVNAQCYVYIRNVIPNRYRAYESLLFGQTVDTKNR